MVGHFRCCYLSRHLGLLGQPKRTSRDNREGLGAAHILGFCVKTSPNSGSFNSFAAEYQNHIQGQNNQKSDSPAASDGLFILSGLRDLQKKLLQQSIQAQQKIKESDRNYNRHNDACFWNCGDSLSWLEQA
eukprot:GHVP01012131.1.p1 GENE.GHVP01012131.1~~GHVP01012131.1.p1  ORF type:complete len:131 (-),score=13.49 GHVP01012131.1:116-508(-)